MTIRFLKTPEANVPSVPGPTMFVDTDGTPKLKQADDTVEDLLAVTATNVVLGTGDPAAVADATALFGKEYDGVVELAIKRGTLPAVRITQGAGLVLGVSNYFPGSTQTADLPLQIPASTPLVVFDATDSAPTGGPIEITTTTPHGLLTGATVVISGVLGTVEADGTWTITVTSVSTFTLSGSFFANTYISGGLVQKTSFTNFPLAGATVTPTPAVWCVYQCHLELVSLNENYQSQTSPPDYDDMRGLTFSGDFGLLFNNGGGTPDTRYASGGPFIPIAILLTLEGVPVLSTTAFPSEVLVDNLGVLSLRVANSGNQKYWAVLRLTVSPPLTVPGPP